MMSILYVYITPNPYAREFLCELENALSFKTSKPHSFITIAGDLNLNI